jgi:hypothetical protein
MRFDKQLPGERSPLTLVGGVAAFGEVVFRGFLFAAMSWTFSQALAGCAAYAQAMYPVFVDFEEYIDRRDPVDGPQPEPGDCNRFPSQTSRPSEMFPSANDEIRKNGPLSRSRQIRFDEDTPIEAKYIVQWESTRAVSSGWRASITSLPAKLRSKIFRERGGRLAIGEQRVLDHRTRRDVGISRCDVG